MSVWLDRVLLDQIAGRWQLLRILRRDAELYALFFDVPYEPAGRAIERDLARRLRLLVSKFQIPDDVNPAKNRTFGGITDHLIPFHSEFAAYTFQPLTPEFWIVWVQKNKKCMIFAVPALMHQKQFSGQGFQPIYFEILQEL
jgi:hypothetical protein